MINRSNFYIAILFLALLTSFGMVSCRKILDTDPLDKFSNENFWTSETNAMMALTGVYRGNIQMNNLAEFSPTDWWSYMGMIFLETPTDNAYHRAGDNNLFNRLSNGTMTADNGHLQLYWQNSYRRIARANFFLENIDKAPVSQELINRFKAEARFIRACQYFYLSQFWGSVPLVVETLSLEDANSVTKATKENVVAFVINEFAEIAPSLPEESVLPASQRGRATKQAALLRHEVAHFDSEFYSVS